MFEDKYLPGDTVSLIQKWHIPKYLAQIRIFLLKLVSRWSTKKDTSK